MKQNRFMARKQDSILLIMLMTIFAILPVHAENIRGEIAGTLRSGDKSIVFSPEEIVIIDSGSISTFQEGIELHLEIPENLNRYQNSFALLIFRSITPYPGQDERSYEGTRAYMRLLPSRTSFFIRIPFSGNHDISGDALTSVLPVPVTTDQFPLVLTVLPVMKGIPDRAFRERLSISVVPLWEDEGSLSVNIANPSGNPEEIINITLDSNTITADKEIILPAGIHRVRVSSTHAPTVEKIIALEPGQTASLSIDLDYRPPELTISIPEGASILLDEDFETAEPIAVVVTTPGDHIITYRLGNLEVSRHFTVRPGGKIKINLAIDIGIVDLAESSGSEYGAGDG